MARVIKCYCDRCGKEVNDDMLYDIEYPYFNSEYNEVATKYAELCKDCINELYLFIMGKSNKASMRRDS